MEASLRILLLEDSPTDAELVKRLLLKESRAFDIHLSANKESFLEELEIFNPDLILADNALPGFNATEALQLVNRRMQHIPFILVTGTVSEEFAAEIIKQGADDYILKDRMARLPMAIDAALTKRNLEKQKAEALQHLVQSEENLKAIFENTSEGFIFVDTEGIVKVFNNRSQESIIFIRQEKLRVGASVYELIEPERVAFFRKVMDRVLEGNVVQYDRSFTLKDGQVEWISFTFNPVRRDNVINGLCITGRNITAKKLAEQQKEFDRNNLHALINNTRDLMWSVDRQLRLVTSNQAFNELVQMMTGRLPEPGKNILEYGINDDQQESFRKYYERVFAGESFSEMIHVASPQEFWAALSFYPIYESKEVVGAAAFSKNITEQKKAEEEIRKSHERYDAVAKATSDAIWDHDFETGRTFIMGTGYRQLFGYDIVNDFSEPLFWENRLHHKDKARVLRELAIALADPNCIQSGSEYRFKKLDDSWAYVNDRFFIIRENGVPVRMLGAKQDITKRKEAEEDLRRNFLEKRELAERMASILNTLPANIALLDINGILVEVNESWKTFAEDNGYAGSNYCIGENYIDVSNNSFGDNEIDGKAVAKGIRAVLKGKVREFVYEYPCHSTKTKRWFRMVVTPLSEKDNSGAVVMHIDISELRLLERERLQTRMDQQKKITRAMVQAQEKERNELGRELHDNISQLLAAIKMKLVYSQSHPEKLDFIIPECIKHVHEAMTEARNLSHRMVMPRFSESSFCQELQQLLTKYEDDHRYISLQASKLDERMLSAGIKETLYRIVQEQLNNIEKYAKASRVKVEMLSYPDNVILAIEDNGVGFDTTKRRKGIGLTNILNRAESYNGSATIVSEPGKGCKLLVEVPLRES